MTIRPNPKWRGDPTFLPEVLRAFGVRVVEAPSWKEYGHGDFGAIQGIVVHHIGSNTYHWSNIQQHPTLGLCSQIHLSRSGVATLVGAGIAWHAGKGSKRGWPTNDANRVSIGIEPESNGVSAWPKAELDAYYRICAAILWFLGKRATTKTLIAHWEYSNHVQGKWDPGAGNGRSGAMMEMNRFRAKVNYYIDNPPFISTKKEEPELAFDEIKRRYRSRVAGSKTTMRPIDAILNADAHAFYARSTTDRIEKEQKEQRQMLDRLIEKAGA